MLPLALVLATLAGQEDLRVERLGPHFRVVAHVGPEKLADEALAAVETAWPLALAALGVKEKKLAAPLEVHLYPDAASYEAAEAARTGGKFRRNLAFSHWESKSAHVALQPPASPEALLEFGLPLLTRYTLAHEAGHLVSYAHVPNSLDHFEWLAEGFTTHVGQETLRKLGLARAGLADPLLAESAVRARKLLDGEKLPGVDKILGGEIGDLDFYARYGVNHAFYELLLAEHEKDLAKTVEAFRKQGGGEGFRAGVLGELGKIWKPKELEKLQAEWLARVRAAEPEWEEVRRSLERRGEDFLQRAFDNSNALAFRRERLDALPIVAEGRVRAVPGRAHQMNFLFGRSEQGFLSVAFHFPESVTVFRCNYGREAAEWIVLGQVECKTLRIGAETPFQVVAGAEDVAVSVHGAEVLRAKLHGRSPLGEWGLGAQENTTGEWKALRVRAGAEAGER